MNIIKCKHNETLNNNKNIEIEFKYINEYNNNIILVLYKQKYDE